MSRRQTAQFLALDPEDLAALGGRFASRIVHRERKHLDKGDIPLTDEEFYARYVLHEEVDEDEPRACASCGREAGCNCHVGEDDVYEYPDSFYSVRGWFGHEKAGYYKHVQMEELGYSQRNSFTLHVSEDEFGGHWHYFVGLDYRLSRSERDCLGDERFFTNGMAKTSLAAKTMAMRWLGKLLREKFSLPR